MVKYVSGNIFKSNAQTLTITVNCVGVMGAGIAKQCKELFPNTFQQYHRKCKQGIYLPGQPILVSVDRPLLLFPTKDHWRNPSKIEWIKEGLKRIARNSHNFESIAIPPLGCGHGGLQWEQVKVLIEQYLDPLSNLVEVYSPQKRRMAVN